MTILWSGRIAKAVAKYKHAGNTKVLTALYDAIHLLEIYDERSRTILRKRYRDHALKGSKKGVRELHLAQDDLLLYLIFKNDNTVILDKIVSHEELRRRK
jgi:mRNA interferase YafQ